MEQILDRLWLGDATDAEALKYSRGAVLTLNEDIPRLISSIMHVHAPIPDEVFLPPPIWIELLHTLTQLVHQYSVVLVHCRLGVSRSPALVAAYLAWCGHSQDPERALAYVKGKRRRVNVHPETWSGVIAWWGRHQCR